MKKMFADENDNGQKSNYGLRRHEWTKEMSVNQLNLDFFFLFLVFI